MTEETPLEILRFAALRPGPRIIVLGAVHGNEPCGPEAIVRAPEDGFLIFPNPRAVPSQQLCYLGVASTRLFRA